MLITTKNTFITIEEPHIDYLDCAYSARKRCDSCPPEFHGFSKECDSSSTAPTQGSPRLTYASEMSPVTKSVLIRNLPHGTTLSGVSEMLLNRGIFIKREDMKYVSYKTSCSVEITPIVPHLTMSLFQLFHGEYICGNEISVELIEHQKTRGDQSRRKLFVGGLRPQTDTKILRKYFASFGGIVDCGVVSDYNGVSKRFGFCEFVDEASFSKVLNINHYIQGHAVAIRPYTSRK